MIDQKTKQKLSNQNETNAQESADGTCTQSSHKSAPLHRGPLFALQQRSQSRVKINPRLAHKGPVVPRPRDGGHAFRIHRRGNGRFPSVHRFATQMSIDPIV